MGPKGFDVLKPQDILLTGICDHPAMHNLALSLSLGHRMGTGDLDLDIEWGRVASVTTG